MAVKSSSLIWVRDSFIEKNLFITNKSLLEKTYRSATEALIESRSPALLE